MTDFRVWISPARVQHVPAGAVYWEPNNTGSETVPSRTRVSLLILFSLFLISTCSSSLLPESAWSCPSWLTSASRCWRSVMSLWDCRCPMKSTCAWRCCCCSAQVMEHVSLWKMAAVFFKNLFDGSGKNTFYCVYCVIWLKFLSSFPFPCNLSQRGCSAYAPLHEYTQDFDCRY